MNNFILPVDPEKKRSDLIRKIIITSIVLILISSIPEFIHLVISSLYLISATIFFLLVALFINKKGYTNVAAHFALTSLSLSLFVQVLQMGIGSYSHVYYLPLIVSIPYILDNKKIGQIAFHFFLAILLCILCFSFENLSFIDHPSEEFTRYNGQVNIICSFMMCGFFVLLTVIDNNRTQEILLTSKELLESQNDELTKTNRELDHLVYSISHDLRAPIASALGLIELAKMETDPQKLAEYETLKEACLKRLDNFIFEIINYLKNNRLTLKVEKVNISDEIDFVLDMNASFDPSFVITKNIDFDNDFCTDKNRLRIVLNNLISNAVKYARTDGETKTISVSTSYTNNELVIRVEDNGVGIYPQHIEKIFGMFFKSSEKSKGSGLGLYIASEALAKIQGRIEVTSKRGIGTTFTVYIPELKYIESEETESSDTLQEELV